MSMSWRQRTPSAMVTASANGRNAYRPRAVLTSSRYAASVKSSWFDELDIDRRAPRHGKSVATEAVAVVEQKFRGAMTHDEWIRHHVAVECLRIRGRHEASHLVAAPPRDAIRRLGIRQSVL